MRTTVTLDDDVATALDRIQTEQRVTFRQALNAFDPGGPRIARASGGRRHGHHSLT